MYTSHFPRQRDGIHISIKSTIIIIMNMFISNIQKKLALYSFKMFDIIIKIKYVPTKLSYNSFPSS